MLALPRSLEPFTPEQGRLFEEHRKFAGWVCKKFLRSRPHYGDEFNDDINSAAMLALLVSAQRYDPATDAAFTTYAKPRIRGAMLSRIYENATGAPSAYGNLRRHQILADCVRERDYLCGAVDGEQCAPPHDPGATLDDRAAAARVRDALRFVTPPCRRALARHYLDGVPVKRIAAEEGCKRWAINLRINDGLDQMRHALGLKEAV